MKFSTKIPTVVCFTQDWCGHCKRAKPELMKLKNKAGHQYNVEFVTGDDENIRKFNVTGFPTILIFVPQFQKFVVYNQARTAEAITSFLMNNLTDLNSLTIYENAPVVQLKQ
jgi:thiol-disulfide isomerase/thioredoxin